MIRTDVIHSSLLEKRNVSLSILRLDLINPQISGNKWFKLKYNLEKAKATNANTIVTFGGAYSNHLHATAYACQHANIPCIGIVRGNELTHLNETLGDCQRWGMTLKFISREEYKNKTNDIFIEKLREVYGNFYLIPEGGNNEAGTKGISEIMQFIASDTDIVCTPVGTAATLRGLINGASNSQTIVGFNTLKVSTQLVKELNQLPEIETKSFRLINEYHFGGYAKYNLQLIEFLQSFRDEYDIELDFVYTAKMMFGIFDLIEKDKTFENKNIVAIHTGGIQGNRSLSFLSKKKHT